MSARHVAQQEERAFKVFTKGIMLQQAAADAAALSMQDSCNNLLHVVDSDVAQQEEHALKVLIRGSMPE